MCDVEVNGTIVKQDICQQGCPRVCPETQWQCDNKCIGKNRPCNKTTCPPGATINCKKTACERVQSEFLCNGTCQKLERPCDGKCHPNNPLNCGIACLKDDVKILEREKKWNCNGTCLNETDSCNGTCYKPNWDINCNGVCELKQTMYNCSGVCQSVTQKCQGKCSSLGRPWECPSNKDFCVSDYICSIDDEPISIGLDGQNCSYIYQNYTKVCTRIQDPEKVKCK